MKVNRVRQALAAGRAAKGPSVWSGSPTIAETFAGFPFDFVYLDSEHTPFKSFETLVTLARAIEARGNSAWVRVPFNDPYLISQVAELGFQGIVVPHVRTAEDAAAAKAAVCYPPTGTRGVCPLVRTFDYNFSMQDATGPAAGSWRASVEEDGANTMVLGLIEDYAALDELDRILETSIDGLMVGTGDMSFTMTDSSGRGLGMDFFHPDVIAVRNRIIDKCREHGKPAMCSVGHLLESGLSPAEAIEYWSARGVGIFHLGVDVQLLVNFCRGWFPPTDEPS